jgi:hypothetical protein
MTQVSVPRRNRSSTRVPVFLPGTGWDVTTEASPTVDATTGAPWVCCWSDAKSAVAPAAVANRETTIDSTWPVAWLAYCATYADWKPCVRSAAAARVAAAPVPE